MNRILEIINEQPPLKKWSERSSKQNRIKLIHKILKILNWASGGELRRMIFSLMRIRKFNFSKLTRESRALNQLIPHINERVVQKNKHCFVKAFRDSKFSFDQVKYLGLKLSKHLWYSCLNTNERNIGGRTGLHDFLKPKINNFLELNSEIAANRTSLEIIKRPANRKKNGVIIKQKNERLTENARYLTKPLSELQKNFNHEIADDLNNHEIPCRVTFYKHRKRLFKKAKRTSDMCDYCVFGNKLKKNIDEFIRLHFNDLYQENFDLTFYLREFSRGLPSKNFPAYLLNDLNEQFVDEILNIEPEAEIPFIDSIIDKRVEDSDMNSMTEGCNVEDYNDEMVIDFNEDDSDEADDLNEPNSTEISHLNIFKQLQILRQINFHKTIARIQRESYNKMINEKNAFYSDCLTIEMDFKQKITYGLGKDAKSSDYYRQKQCSCLGFGIYYLDQKKLPNETNGPLLEFVNCTRVDIFSDCLEQDANAVLRAFKFLRNQEFFKKIDKKKYNLWTDCGGHFRNKTLAHYFFRELKSEEILCNWNFFLEKHGKSQCDTHFSSVSRFINQASKEKKLECVDDVIASVETGQQQANENNTDRNGRGEIKLLCFKLNPELITKIPYKKLILPEVPILVIPNLKSYYNLHTNENFEIKTSILANSGKSYDLHLEENEASIGQNVNTLLKFKGSVLVKDKYLNIQKNLGNKEIFFKTISKKKSLLAYDSINNTPSCSQNTKNPNSFFVNDLPIPPRCMERINVNQKAPKTNSHGENCLVFAKYSLNQVQNLSANAAQDELFAHGHAKYLKLPRNKTRDLAQAREELILHYKKYHTGTLVDPSKANSSKNLT